MITIFCVGFVLFTATIFYDFGKKMGARQCERLVNGILDEQVRQFAREFYPDDPHGVRRVCSRMREQSAKSMVEALEGMIGKTL